MTNYFVNEGNRIGGSEQLSLDVSAKRILASADISKGQIVEVSGDWTVGPASDGSVKVFGIATLDVSNGEPIVVETEGFVKLSASGAITAGDSLVSATNGLAVRAYDSVGTDTADMIIGKAINTVADGETVYAKLTL